MNSFRIKLSKGTILPFSFLLQLPLGNWKLSFLILSLHKKFYFLTLFTNPNSSIYPEWFHSGSEWIHSVLEWIHTVPEYIHSGLTFLIVIINPVQSVVRDPVLSIHEPGHAPPAAPLQPRVQLLLFIHQHHLVAVIIITGTKVKITQAASRSQSTAAALQPQHNHIIIFTSVRVGGRAGGRPMLISFLTAKWWRDSWWWMVSLTRTITFIFVRREE